MNEMHGKGSLYREGTNQLRYQGEFQNNKYHGFGERFDKKGGKKYSGNFKDGIYAGEGVLYHKDGITKKYVGVFHQKKYHQHGTLYNDKGNMLYKGGFQLGKYQGKGTLYNEEKANVVMYEGDFNDG